MRDWKDASAPAVPGLVRRAASAGLFRSKRFTETPALQPWAEYLWTVDRDLSDAAPVESRVISFPPPHRTAEPGRPSAHLPTKTSQDPTLALLVRRIELELAVRLGWYDQAHLTNDLRRMLGETPARYAARAREGAR